MVLASILVSTSMPIFIDLLVGPEECSGETAISKFMVLARLSMIIQHSVKLGNVLKLLHCCSTIKALVTKAEWLC